MSVFHCDGDSILTESVVVESDDHAYFSKKTIANDDVIDAS
jgi:hypothetical protein